MKITRNDGTRLEISNTQFLFTLLLCGFGGGALWKSTHDYLHHAAAQKDITVMFVVGILFLVVGFCIAQRTSFSFDILGRTLTWKRWTLFGSTGGSIPFTKIKGAFFDSEFMKPTMVRLALRLENGNVLPLRQMYLKDPTRTETTALEVINRILGAKEADLKEIDPVNDLIRTGQIIAAIRVVRQRENCGLAEAKAIVEKIKDSLPLDF